MTIGLTKADASYLIKGIFGPARAVLTAVPMVREQGNGNFTGFIRTTYSDGEIINSEFIVNAKTRDDVRAAYSTSPREMAG